MFKQISHNPDSKIIGVTNGVFQVEFEKEELKKNENFKEIEDKLLKTNINRFLNIQNDIKNLRIEHLKGTLLKKAKLTDIMVFSPFFFGYPYIVSEKFVDCLKEEKVNKEEYHLRKVEIDSIDHNYYLFFVPIIPDKEIIFSESLMYPEEDFLSPVRNYINIKTYKDYCKIIQTNYFNRWEKITINRKYKNQSIINLQSCVELFFSDKLVEKLRLNNVTGLIVKDSIQLQFI